MNIIGFEQIKTKLDNSYQNNKFHHANLIYGKRGLGKASFVKNFCLEKLNQPTNSNHPNLRIISKPLEKSSISIEQIRKDLFDFFNLTSAVDQPKFVLIDSACQLNKASNSILKALEEPQKNCYIFLIAHNLSAILPTIKSRCNLICAPNFDDAQFQQILKINNLQFDQQTTKFLKLITDNSPALAIDLNNNLVNAYQILLQSFLNKKIDEDFFKFLTEKNNNSVILEKVITFFFQRLIYEFEGLNSQHYFQEQQVFNWLTNKISKTNCLEKIEMINKNLSFTSTIYLDKKLFIYNFFNQFIL